MSESDVSAKSDETTVHACKSNDAREAIRGLTKVRESNAQRPISAGNCAGCRDGLNKRGLTIHTIFSHSQLTWTKKP